jgi:hypothetical protein
MKITGSIIPVFAGAKSRLDRHDSLYILETDPFIPERKIIIAE